MECLAIADTVVALVAMVLTMMGVVTPSRYTTVMWEFSTAAWALNALMYYRRFTTLGSEPPSRN